MQEEQCFQPVLSIACIRRIRFHLDRPPGPPFSPDASCANDLLELLLGTELVGVTALLLALWRLLVHHVGVARLPLIVRERCRGGGRVRS